MQINVAFFYKFSILWSEKNRHKIIQKIRLFFFVCVDWKRFDRLPRTEYGEVCKFRYFTGKRKTCGKLSRLRRIYIWLSIQWRPRWLSIHFCMEFYSLLNLFVFVQSFDYSRLGLWHCTVDSANADRVSFPEKSLISFFQKKIKPYRTFYQKHVAVDK